jgi:hypothetical protein
MKLNARMGARVSVVTISLLWVAAGGRLLIGSRGEITIPGSLNNPLTRANQVMPRRCLLAEKINWTTNQNRDRWVKHSDDEGAAFFGVRQLALDRTVQGLLPLSSASLPDPTS